MSRLSRRYQDDAKKDNLHTDLQYHPLTIPASTSTCLYRCLWDVDYHADQQSDPLTISVLLPTSVYIVISVVHELTMYQLEYRNMEFFMLQLMDKYILSHLTLPINLHLSSLSNLPALFFLYPAGLQQEGPPLWSRSCSRFLPS